MSRARHADARSTVSATGASGPAPASARVSAGSAAYRACSSASQRTGSTTGPRAPAIAREPSPERPEHGPDVGGKRDQGVGARARASERAVGDRRPAPTPTTLLHAVLVEESGALEIDAHEHATRRRPRERNLSRVERVAGEEPRVLLGERARRPRDRGGARHRRTPGRTVERVVGLHGAGERHGEVAVPDQTGDPPIRLPGPRLDRAPRGGEPHAAPCVGEDERGEVRSTRRGGGDRAEGSLLEDLLDRRREETHPFTASLPAPGGSASIAPVQRIWLPRLASTPPDHHASPVQRAPPTTAPARIGRLRLGPFATT